MAPDRVPPPATGALQPGTAQPFYPGDQVPVILRCEQHQALFRQVQATLLHRKPSPVTPPGGWNQPAPARQCYPLRRATHRAATHQQLSARSRAKWFEWHPTMRSLRFASVPNSNPIRHPAGRRRISRRSSSKATSHTPPIATQGFTQSQRHQMSVDVTARHASAFRRSQRWFPSPGSSRAADSSFESPRISAAGQSIAGRQQSVWL